MIPMILKLSIPRAGKDSLLLYLPVILCWLLLLALMLTLLPLILIAAVFTWNRGRGRFLLFCIPMCVSLLWHLQGLIIRVKNDETDLDIQFI